jgi:large subunit ribosomal protein L29
MKIEVLRDLTRDEVMMKKVELEEELFNLRLMKKTKQAHNPVRMRYVRRDLARILTLLREEQLGTTRMAESGKIILDKKE